MPPLPKPVARSASQTRARILEAAQAAFADRGYSQTGLREIAKRAGVASSLVVKYFQTKANLFDQALTAALKDVNYLDEDKANFARMLVQSVLDPKARITAPAMIALSLGDDEARQIAVKVAREHIVAPVAAWLNAPDARSRATQTLILSTGFAIFSRYMDLEPTLEARTATSAWMERTLQAVIDGTPVPRP